MHLGLDLAATPQQSLCIPKWAEMQWKCNKKANKISCCLLISPSNNWPWTGGTGRLLPVKVCEHSAQISKANLTRCPSASSCSLICIHCSVMAILQVQQWRQWLAAVIALLEWNIFKLIYINCCRQTMLTHFLYPYSWNTSRQSLHATHILELSQLSPQKGKVRICVREREREA